MRQVKIIEFNYDIDKFQKLINEFFELICNWECILLKVQYLSDRNGRVRSCVVEYDDCDGMPSKENE